jgi:hypothetical protein
VAEIRPVLNCNMFSEVELGIAWFDGTSRSMWIFRTDSEKCNLIDHQNVRTSANEVLRDFPTAFSSLGFRALYSTSFKISFSFSLKTIPEIVSTLLSGQFMGLSHWCQTAIRSRADEAVVPSDISRVRVRIRRA